MTEEVVLLENDLTSEALERFARSDRVAWDIETTGLDWSAGRIATCQLHSPEAGTTIIRIGSERPSRLVDLLSDEAVLKVFHHAPFDLRWMTSHWRAEPASVACTKVASRLLNSDPDSRVHSLKHLLLDRLGVDIDKGERLSDWTAPNLSRSQLAYAAADVVHLLPLLDVLKKELDNVGLLSIYQHCLCFLPTRVYLEVAGSPDVFSY